MWATLDWWWGVDEHCRARDPGESHIWRKHGWHTVPDGSSVQRWQCRECKQTTIQRPDDESSQPPRPGPERGHTAEHPEGTTAFWSALDRHMYRVGLYEAARLASREVGVHETTGWRWIKNPQRRGMKWWNQVVSDPGLLLPALGVIRGFNTKMPSPRGVDAWQFMLLWKHLPDIPEPPASRVLREFGWQVWLSLLESACQAALVVGNGNPLRFATRLGVPTVGAVKDLRDGGLLSRAHGARRFTYWFSFDPPEAEYPYDHAMVTYVCTRTRVVGRTVDELSSDAWVQLTVRLDLDNATAGEDTITVPVPTATVMYHRTPLEFPLELAYLPGPRQRTR